MDQGAEYITGQLKARRRYEMMMRLSRILEKLLQRLLDVFVVLVVLLDMKLESRILSVL